MLKNIVFVLFSFPLFLTGCVAPPVSPAEAAARKAAGAEYAAKKCGFMVGGFSDARELKRVANQEIVKARALGATDGLIAKARTDVANAVGTAAAFSSPREACGSLMAELAWSTT